MEIILSNLAVEDIENILGYTLKTWGNSQFENYYSLIQSTLDEIGSNPYCPTCYKREELFIGCITKIFGKHIVFYRVANMRVEVVRILHQQMDFRSKL